jgi:hypothetical protein
MRGIYNTLFSLLLANEANIQEYLSLEILSVLLEFNNVNFDQARKRLATDKHSSLFFQSISAEEKKVSLD